MADKKKPTQTGWFAGCTGQAAAPSAPPKAKDGGGFASGANTPLPKIADGAEKK